MKADPKVIGVEVNVDMIHAQGFDSCSMVIGNTWASGRGPRDQL